MIMYNFIVPLVLTVLFETVVAYVMGIRNREGLFTVVLANLITNPCINLINYLMFHFYVSDDLRRLILYLLLEPLAVVVEALIYRYNLDTEVNCWHISLAANVISVIGGMICLNLLF